MLEKLQEILIQRTNDTSIVLTPELNLVTDLELDSFDLIDLVVQLEDTFNIEIPDRVITKFITIHDVITYIEEHQS